MRAVAQEKHVIRPISSYVAEVLGLLVEEVQNLAACAQQTYKHYLIKKKNGTGFRKIYHPSRQTKALQYALMGLLEDALRPHECAMAFRRGFSSPLRKNGETHAGCPYTLRIDFKDFFPSIRPEDLFASVEAGGDPGRIELEPADRRFLTEVLFVKGRDGRVGLPIGAPSSPMVSNGVMRSMDERIAGLARQREFIYTRYADDLVFSTMNKHSSKPFLLELTNLIGSCEHPKVTINPLKTRLMSRNCHRAVTGLIITPLGEVSIGRERKRLLAARLNRFRLDQIREEKELHVLQGHLAYVMDVEPRFFNRLCQKYGAEVVLSALRHRGDNAGDAVDRA
jgi:hypothetical protein